MHVFVTGATGFIGSRIVLELIGAGHQVLGLTRSAGGARRLEEAGAEPYHGDLENPASLARGALEADAVIHTAFDHDFTNFLANCEKDRRVIEAMGDAVAGSNTPLIITSGTPMGSRTPGEVATEDVVNLQSPNPRVASEQAAAEMLERGASIAVMRLPQVHDRVKQGLVSPLIEIARQKRRSAYVGEGANRWPAAHITDVARLFRLAIESHEAGARWHAVAEDGIPLRKIAETIGAGLGVPVASVSADEAADHFGWAAAFAAADMPASSALTRERLGWKPVGPGLTADLEKMDFATAQQAT